MDKADLYRVYLLGGTIRPFSSLPDQATVQDIFPLVLNAKTAVEELLGHNPQTAIDIARSSVLELKGALEQMELAHFRNDQGQFFYPENAQNTPIDIFAWWRLKPAVQAFEAVFRAEMEAAAAYWVPKRGTYATRDLVDSFEKSFSDDLHATIGELGLAEYKSAGRCFAFGLWTATGYHSCRAVEAVMRKYYLFHLERDGENRKTSGDLIGDLNGIEGDDKPREKTMFYLNEIKDNERNPLMHVRAVLDKEDADLLLSSAKVVIGHMAREMRDEAAPLEAARPAQIAAAE